MKFPDVKTLIGYYFLPVLAASSFALVSHPALAAWALSRFGWSADVNSELTSDVRTLLVLIGFGATVLSIWYARREVRTLTELNQKLSRSETRLVETEQALSKRVSDWVDFKGKSFEGLKHVLDSYLSHLATEHYRKATNTAPQGRSAYQSTLMMNEAKSFHL